MESRLEDLEKSVKAMAKQELKEQVRLAVFTHTFRLLMTLGTSANPGCQVGGRRERGIQPQIDAGGARPKGWSTTTYSQRYAPSSTTTTAFSKQVLDRASESGSPTSLRSEMQRLKELVKGLTNDVLNSQIKLSKMCSTRSLNAQSGSITSESHDGQGTSSDEDLEDHGVYTHSMSSLLKLTPLAPVVKIRVLQATSALPMKSRTPSMLMHCLTVPVSLYHPLFKAPLPKTVHGP